MTVDLMEQEIIKIMESIDIPYINFINRIDNDNSIKKLFH